MRPLRIAHITEAYEGGIVTFLRDVLPRQAAAGLHVTLICSPRQARRHDPDLEHLRGSAVDVQIVPMSRGLAPLCDAEALARIRRLLLTGRFDLVHTHCFKAGLLGRLAAWTVGPLATIHTPHCFVFQRASLSVVRQGTRLLERSFSRRTDCLHLVSASQHAAAGHAGILACQHVLIPNGVALLPLPTSHQAQQARRMLAIPNDACVIGACCRLSRYKKVEHLVDAAAVLAARLPNLVCLVIGDGPERARIVHRVRRSRLDQHIRLLGNCPQMDRVWPALDLLVQCSQAEGMPYSLLEAMSRAVPVLASDVPGHADLLTDGQTGLLYRYGDRAALQESILRMLTDHALRNRIRFAGRQHVIRYYSIDSQVDALLALYERLCTQRATWRGPLSHARCINA